MSKENKPKGKIRVFLFELEGTDETLLESVRSIAGAVNRTFSNSPRVVKALTSTKDGEVESELDAEIDFAEIEEGTSNSDVEETPSAPKAKKARKYPTPEIVSELDLTTGDNPFRPFCEQKKPANDTMKYLVIAAWLKDVREIKEIDIHHVYTCYRAMGWTAPQDMGRVFRNAKGLGYFSKGSSSNLWAINHIGMNKVLELNN